MSIYAVKIAMIFEASVTDQMTDISLESMQSATRLIEFLLSNLREMLASVAFGRNGGEMAKVAQIIKQARNIKHRDTLRKSKLLASDFAKIIETLHQQGVIQVAEGLKPASGPKPIHYVWHG